LAVECRADDGRTRDGLAAIEHGHSRRAVDTERAWLREIGSGCNLPVGALATVAVDGTITLTAALGSLDGRVLLRAHGDGDDADELGARLARELLDDAGGRALLTDLRVEPVA
jgi:hydroxymethylbilane synthase